MGPYIRYGDGAWQEDGQEYGQRLSGGIYQTAEEALNAARALVGLARVKRHGLASGISREALRTELFAELRPEVWAELEQRLRPLVEKEIALRVERERWEQEKQEHGKRESMAKLVETYEAKAEAEKPSLGKKVKELAGSAATTVRSDARKMAFRSFGRKIVQGAQTGLVRFLKDKGVGPRAREPLVEMIQSEAGKAVIGYTIGTLGAFLPGMAGRPVVAEACEELRVEAMSLGLDHLLSGVGEYLLPDIFGHVSALEAAMQPEAPSAAPVEAE